MIFITVVAGQWLFSQTVDTPYEVATWWGFRQAAISYTFDDGCPNQLALAVPLFDEFGFPLTLFTVTDWSPDWNALRRAAARGHEIASHTVSHPHLDKLNEEGQIAELKNSRDEIDAQVTSQKCLTIAYPYCVAGDDSICAEYYLAARACQGYIESNNPDNFLNISSIICGSNGPVQTGWDFRRRADRAASANGWCVYLIHGLDTENDGWSPTSSRELRRSLKYLDTNRETFWVATFVDVVRYIRERNAFSVIETGCQENRIVVQVTDTLDNEIYNHPITIRRLLPDGWLAATVKQGERRMNSQVIAADMVRYIMFDAVPDGGEVIITGSVVPGFENR